MADRVNRRNKLTYRNVVEWWMFRHTCNGVSCLGVNHGFFLSYNHGVNLRRTTVVFLLQMQHDSVVVDAGQPAPEPVHRRLGKLRVLHLLRKQRVDAGGQLGVEARRAILMRSYWDDGVHWAHVFHDDPTSRWFLRVRPDHSQRSSLTPNAAYVLDSTIWRRQNNTR